MRERDEVAGIGSAPTPRRFLRFALRSLELAASRASQHLICHAEKLEKTWMEKAEESLHYECVTIELPLIFLHLRGLISLGIKVLESRF